MNYPIVSFPTGFNKIVTPKFNMANKLPKETNENEPLFIEPATTSPPLFRDLTMEDSPNAPPSNGW
jgi:hypothetical protein